MTTSGPAVGKGRLIAIVEEIRFGLLKKGNFNDEDCMNMIIHDEW